VEKCPAARSIADVLGHYLGPQGRSLGGRCGNAELIFLEENFTTDPTGDADFTDQKDPAVDGSVQQKAGL